MTNLEWTGTKFEEVPPKAQPKAKVKSTVMTKAMASFGCNLSKKEADHVRESLELRSLADTGAQTNSTCMSLLDKLNFLDQW